MRRLALFATSTIFFVSGGAWAQVDMRSSGYNVLTCEASVMELEEGHMVISWKGRGIQISFPDKPWHMSQLECVSTTEIFPDKSFKSSGFCSHADRDGDKWINRTSQDSSMPKGRFQATGISGKYKGGHDAGTFVYTDLSSATGCRGVASWESDR